MRFFYPTRVFFLPDPRIVNVAHAPFLIIRINKQVNEVTHCIIRRFDAHTIVEPPIALREHISGRLAVISAHTEPRLVARLAPYVFEKFSLDQLKDALAAFHIFSILDGSSPFASGSRRREIFFSDMIANEVTAVRLDKLDFLIVADRDGARA